ncbi:hypothetical protein V1478_013075 [Vespula squamosa]|uniref:Uncharacterized protein n=1 Tax=Vespula squamosa TaxID=30214 RepID=A0ABD2A9Y4_VESSQ
MSPLGGEKRIETLLHLPFPRDVLFSTLLALLTNEKPTSSSSPRDLFTLKFAQVNLNPNSIKKSYEGENLDLETGRLLSLQTSLPKPTLYETSTGRKEAYVLQSSTFADDNFFQALANERSTDAAKGANGYIPSYTVVKRQD